MEKQDIDLIKQIQQEKIKWTQWTIDKALSLQVEGFVKYSATKQSGQWEVTEKGRIHAEI